MAPPYPSVANTTGSLFDSKMFILISEYDVNKVKTFVFNDWSFRVALFCLFDSTYECKDGFGFLNLKKVKKKLKKPTL